MDSIAQIIEKTLGDVCIGIAAASIVILIVFFLIRKFVK